VTHVTDLGDSGWTPLRPIVGVGTLEKEEGGEVLPGERLTGGERDRFIADLEATLTDEFFNGGATVMMEMGIKLFVHALQETGIVEIAVERLAFPAGDGFDVAPATRVAVIGVSSDSCH